MFFTEKISRILTSMQKSPLVWLKIATFCLLLGKAWQHLRWDPPYRALLWDEKWMRGLVESMGWSWQAYINDPLVGQNISTGVKGLGLVLLFAAWSVFLPPKLGKLRTFLLLLSGMILLFLSLLVCKEHGWRAGQFLELGLQWATPCLFLLWNKNSRGAGLWTKIAIASTFIGHGMYALGWYSRPADFLDMSINGLGLNEGQAEVFLKTMGILDFVAAAYLFLPIRGQKWAYFYLIAWGFLTTCARLWSHFNWDFMGNWAAMWLHEWLMRVPHFLVPFYLWLKERANSAIF
jgi:hypothetical protein